jgi:PhoPQ-activated pathogenicity-related protein
LTAAGDPRVVAIAPMVIDVVNFKRQMDYQKEAYGGYSEQINNYTERHFQDRLDTPEGRQLRSIIDPYEYRNKFTMPKLILLGTNDPFWVVDSIKWYFDDLPGKKMIYYTPNAGHGLNGGDQAIRSLAAFLALTVTDKPYPELTWKTSMDGKGTALLTLATSTPCVTANLWQAVSDTRDFRKAEWSIHQTWQNPPGSGEIGISLPEKGYSACYVELVYQSPVRDTYSLTSRTFVIDPKGWIDRKE